jgi:radical SAM protein with 4Fe4S-binding SPASM domain
MQSLNPDFHYLANRADDRAYIVAADGRYSVVNTDAFDLLRDEDDRWLADPVYRAFAEVALRQRWVVPDPAGRPSVRVVDRPCHLKRIQYEIDLRCNLHCAHCYCSASPSAPRGMPTEFVLDLVRQAADLGVLQFDITGGEPMARDDLTMIVAAIRDAGMVPGLFTNCTLVTPERAVALRRAGLAAIQTSLDACTPELHDEFRGRPGAFRRALAGIEAFREAGVATSVSVSLNRRNAHQVAGIVDLLGRQLALPFRLDHVIPAGRGAAEHDPIALSNAEFYALLHPYIGDHQQRITKRVCDSPNLATEGRIEPGCGVGASYMFIKHDGRAALCPTMTEAESPDFAQADLRTMSLAEAWERHPTFRRFRDMQCANAQRCPAGKICRGGCRSNAYLLHGQVDSPDEMNCNVHKNPTSTYREFIREYARVDRDPRFRARRSLTVIGGQS